MYDFLDASSANLSTAGDVSERIQVIDPSEERDDVQRSLRAAFHRRCHLLRRHACGGGGEAEVGDRHARRLLLRSQPAVRSSCSRPLFQQL